MKTQRFFIDPSIKLSGEVTIADRDVIHQIKDVLRLRAGESIIFLDGNGSEFHGELTLVSKDKIIANEKEMKKVSNNSKIKMNLYFAMIKKDKAEWVLQKCTELGVSEFYPVISERTEKPSLNIERAEKIIKEASEQSERVDLPMLHKIISLEEALSEVESNVIVLHTEGTKIDVSQLHASSSLSVFIGPEGGWGEKDLALFKKHNVLLVSMGQNILRAETASVAVSSLILL
jgi:16S rRNA (uracil1498-N3)-methyltransferase